MATVRQRRSESPSVGPLARQSYILSGSIRPSCCADCLKSCFAWHNETVNIWSHALAACTNLCFLIMTLTDAVRKIRGSGDGDRGLPSDLVVRIYLPLVVHGISSVVVMSASTAAHCFHRLSQRIHDIAFTLDYVAIGLYSTSGLVAHFYYCQPGADQPLSSLFSWPALFIIVGTIGHCCAFIAISFNRVKNTLPYTVRKVVMVLAYIVTYLVNFMPFLARSLFCQSPFACLLIEKTYRYHWLQALFALSGGVIVAAQVPEKLAPGRFDMLANSHQLMHFAIWISIWCEWRALRVDLELRWDELLMPALQPDSLLVIAPPIVYLFCSLSFTLFLFRRK